MADSGGQAYQGGLGAVVAGCSSSAGMIEGHNDVSVRQWVGFSLRAQALAKGVLILEGFICLGAFTVASLPHLLRLR